MMARLTAQHLSDQLGQQVVVENQGGAGGTIAANAVARARPDGYTLIFQSVSSAVVNALVYKNLPYDPIKDLIPVTLAGSFPLVLVTNPELPAKDLGELIALLKANPGKYSYGSSGVGTMPHLAGELFKSMAGVDMVHVPYRGNSAIMADLLRRARRDHVRRSADPARQHSRRQGARARHHHGRAFAGAPRRYRRSPTRCRATRSRSGPRSSRPANTPTDIVERIAAETRKAMQSPEVVRRYGDVGIVGIGSSPQELDRFWREQLDLPRQDRQGRERQAGGVGRTACAAPGDASRQTRLAIVSDASSMISADSYCDRLGDHRRSGLPVAQAPSRAPGHLGRLRRKWPFIVHENIRIPPRSRTTSEAPVRGGLRGVSGHQSGSGRLDLRANHGEFVVETFEPAIAHLRLPRGRRKHSALRPTGGARLRSG